MSDEMAETSEFSIGELARAAGCSVQSVRWYEGKGLMPEPARTHGGQRRYTSTHEARLKFLRHARDLGFSLDDIRELLSLTGRPDMTCEVADGIASRHLEEVEARIAALTELRDELKSWCMNAGAGRLPIAV